MEKKENQTETIKEKPASVLIDEFKTDLCNIINSSPLHISVKELVLKNIYNEVSVKNTKVFMEEKIAYENSQKGNAE